MTPGCEDTRGAVSTVGFRMGSIENQFRRLATFHYGTIYVFRFIIIVILNPSDTPAAVSRVITPYVSFDLPMRMSDEQCRFHSQPFRRQS